MDTPCYVNCPTLTTQPVADQNKCKVAQSFEEDIDSCKCSLLGPPSASYSYSFIADNLSPFFVVYRAPTASRQSRCVAAMGRESLIGTCSLGWESAENPPPPRVFKWTFYWLFIPCCANVYCVAQKTLADGNCYHVCKKAAPLRVRRNFNL